MTAGGGRPWHQGFGLSSTGSADAACSKRPEQASTADAQGDAETLGVVGKLTSAAHPTEIDVLGPVPAESTPTQIDPLLPGKSGPLPPGANVGDLGAKIVSLESLLGWVIEP